MSVYNVEQVLGFDFGHGDTAVALNSNLDNKHSNPGILEIYRGRKKIVTAISYLPEQNIILIGEEAVYNPVAQQLRVAFKKRPSVDSSVDLEYQETMRSFLKTVYEKLVSENRFPANKKTLIYIGCPSGWDKNTQRAYETLLTIPEMAPVRVVPESHAALMHARDQKQFSGKELQGTVLVVDLGSSTTDYTVLHGLKEGKGLAQHGYDLGASVIDKAILAHTLAQHPECEQIEALWERHASLRNRCELFCREAKEEYFKNWDYYQNTPYTSALGKPEPFQGLLNKPFRPEVTRELMDQILREPMPELNNQSWPDAFYNQLLNIKHEMKQELDVVLVTGGASRMPFIEEACQQVFPNTRLILDSVPELAIAEGLARWGRVDVRACRFQADVDNLLQKELPHQVSEKLDQLAAKIATNLAGSLITNVIKPDVLKWRDDGSYATLKEMESKMNRHIKAWLGSSHAKNDVTQQVQAWFRKSIYLWLQGKLEKLADQYDLPDAALKLSPAEVEFSADKLPFVNILDSTMGEFNDTVDVIVAVVLGVIIITIIAVSATIGGPLAWLVGFAGWLIGGAVISEGIREQVKSQDIPKWVRPNIIGDDKLNQKLAEERPKLEEAIKNIFNTDTSRSKMATSITKEVQAYVREKTDIARLLIT